MVEKQKIKTVTEINTSIINNIIAVIKKLKINAAQTLNKWYQVTVAYTA